MKSESLLANMRIRRSAPMHLNYQIKKGIQDLITSGKLPPGARLPSVEKLAKLCGVSLNTAKYAIRELAREGVLIARPGLGTYVARRRAPTTELFICDQQPEPGSSAWAFHRQITEGFMKGYTNESRRLMTIYADSHLLDSQEVIASALAKNADCIITYRPGGEFVNTLAVVADEIICISLVYPVPDSTVHTIMINPAEQIRSMLRKRLDSGRRSFAFISLDLEGNLSLESEYNPYAIIYKTFLAVMTEAGIDAPVCMVDGARGNESPALTDFKKMLTRDTTLIGVPNGANSVLGPQWEDNLDYITYTEARNSLKSLTSKNISVIYGGLERCGLEAAILHEKLLKKQRNGKSVCVEVEPEVFDMWDA